MNFRAALAEAIGTFALIFIGICVIANLGQADQNLGLVGIALAHGLTIACLASATAAISGGHLNPAVSLGLWLAKKIDSVTLLIYVAAQMIGGLLGAVLAMDSLPGASMQYVVAGTPALGKGVTMTQGILMEAITTFLLVFVIFGTAVDRRAPKMSALFIGLTVTLDIFAAGPVTGAAMNPARYFGPAIVSGSYANWEVWLVGPAIGAGIAAFVYAVFLEKEPALSPDSPRHAA